VDQAKTVQAETNMNTGRLGSERTLTAALTCTDKMKLTLNTVRSRNK